MICKPYKLFPDKELHGTYSLDGNHQQRSRRWATTHCPGEIGPTLTAAVERLTKQNEILEEQLRQKNAAMGIQEEDQEGTGVEWRDQEGLEGSNAPSRPER